MSTLAPIPRITWETLLNDLAEQAVGWGALSHPTIFIRLVLPVFLRKRLQPTLDLPN
jgi:hypothetical protein